VTALADPFDGAIALVGPTGAGKSELAVEVAEALGAEILGVDSQQVYRDLPVGTAQPSADLRQRVPHHLIGFLASEERMTAARFAELATQAAREITGRGNRLVLVGGTGLYFRAVLEGLVEAPPADHGLRSELMREADGPDGKRALHDRLTRLDPEVAGRVSPNDLVRVVRAMEIALLTGQPASVLQAAQVKRRPLVTWVGVSPPRADLYQRIDTRTARLFASGLLEEARGLMTRGLDTSPAAGSIGYAQALRHLRGEIDLSEAIAEVSQATRRYAKRQLTWFGANAQIRWLNWPAGAREVLAVVAEGSRRPHEG
jgi:tRNA dimethylallyltransferase